MTICVWDGIAACIVGDKEALERKGLLPFSLRYSQSWWVSYVSAIMVGELRQQELHQLEHRQLDLFPGSQEAERDEYWAQLTLSFVCSSRPHPGSGAVFRVGSSHPS